MAAGVPDEELPKITCDNACRWYSFEPFAHRPRERSRSALASRGGRSLGGDPLLRPGQLRADGERCGPGGDRGQGDRLGAPRPEWEAADSRARCWCGAGPHAPCPPSSSCSA